MDDEIIVCPSYPDYGATKDGRVFRVTKYNFSRPVPFELKQYHDKDGYMRTGSDKRVSRLVADAFISEGKGKPHVAHKNGIRDDNRASNLKWATALENADDKVAHGTTLEADRHPTSKLSSGQVIFIRGLAARGISHRELAEIMPVCRGVISRLIRGETWRMQY